MTARRLAPFRYTNWARSTGGLPLTALAATLAVVALGRPTVGGEAQSEVRATRESRLYRHYAWSGTYGEKDEWLQVWRG